MAMDNDDQNRDHSDEHRDGPRLPLDANGAAYTKSEERHGVPLDYVGQKLSHAIEALSQVSRDHPQLRPELMTAMHYLVVAHLGLHNMLAKTNDRKLVDRLMTMTSDELDQWLAMTIQHGDVEGTASIGMN